MKRGGLLEDGDAEVREVVAVRVREDSVETIVESLIGLLLDTPFCEVTNACELSLMLGVDRLCEAAELCCDAEVENIRLPTGELVLRDADGLKLDSDCNVSVSVPVRLSDVDMVGGGALPLLLLLLVVKSGSVENAVDA